MELKVETQQIFVISDYHNSKNKPKNLMELMPISRVFELQSRVRAVYPDVRVSPRPNGDIELRFTEPFFGGDVPELLAKEVASFMADYGYKV